MKQWRLWLLPALAGGAFALIYVLDLNRVLFALLNAAGPATSAALWANVTVLGDAMVAFALCLPLWRRRPDLLWALVFVVALGTLWVHGMKPVVDVSRPPAVLGADVHVIGPAYRSHSFPSGHATTAFGIGGLLVLGLKSRLWAALVLTLALLVAISRAVVGVHWPLDILAGIFGGWLCAAAGLWIGRRTRRIGERSWVQWTLAVLLAACAVALVLGELMPFPLGPAKDYPAASDLLRAIGVCCLAAAAARLKHASQSAAA